MKKLIIAISLLVILLLAAILVLPGLVSSDVYKDKIQAKLSEELGRTVSIDGDVNLSVFPVIKAQTGRITIANAEGFDADYLAEMQGLDARVKLLPLLSKKIEISKFTLVEPVIDLQKKTDGSTNWTFAKEGETVPAETEDKGPFKRDGRFNAVDPQIGKFSIENAAIRYRDASNNTSHNLTNANLAFSLSSLADPVTVKGDLTFDGTPVDLSLSLDTPRSFLDGKASPVEIFMDTGFAKIDAQGQFLDSQDIAFSLNTDGNISDVAKLKQFLPESIPNQNYLSLANSVDISGQYDFDGKILKANGAKIQISGDDIDLKYSGNATLAEKPVLDGNIEAKVTNVKKIANILEQDIQGLETISALDFRADMQAQGQGFVANNVDAKVTGTGLQASFKGQGNYQDSITLNGPFTAKIDNLPSLLTAFGQDIPQANIVDSLNTSGNLSLNGEDFKADFDALKINGETLTANYTGQFSKAGELITANGNFNADIPSFARLNQIAKLDIAQAAAIGAVKASGTINLNGEDIQSDISSLTINGDVLSANYNGRVKKLGENISADGAFSADIPSFVRLNEIANLEIAQAGAIGAVKASGVLSHGGTNTNLNDVKVQLSNGALNGNFAGKGTYADTLSLNGNFDIDVPSAQTLATQANIENPYLSSIGRLSSTGRLELNGTQYKLEDLNAQLRDGQLNGSFTGSVTQSASLNVNGQLNADIASLRQIAQASGTVLPPSTQAGAIYENFKISGLVSGSPENLTFDNANVTLDAITGTGSFGVKTVNQRPNLSGTLNFAGLDLRPYMASYAAQNPSGNIEPWSEEPINVEMLRSVDGNFKITTPNIVTDRMSLGQSNITAALANGRLTADFPNMTLYGGQGNMRAVVNANGAIPTLDMSFDLSRMQSNSFLQAVAGFANLTGTAGTKFSFKGAGRSQAEIMRSLTGGGDFSILDGKVSGVDVTQFVSGIDQAFTSRSLPSGIGPSFSTAFQDMVGAVTIQNGVAKLNDFNLSGLGVSATGGGQMDLGAQTVDFSLRPRLTGTNATGLAAFGIPIRMTGSFGSIKAGLDTDMLGQIVAERAQARAQQEVSKLITKNVGGSAGALLGSVLGTGSPTSGSTAPTATTPTPAQRPSTEQALGNVLGGLLGGGGQSPATQPSGTTQQAPAKEPSIEDALSGLFGKKKKN